TGQHRQAVAAHDVARLRLVPHRADALGGRPDELDADRFAHLREVGVLGQEAVPRVDGVAGGDFCRAEDVRDVAVAERWIVRYDVPPFVRRSHGEVSL